ncbi:unnamed protein product [Phytomonas sp. EM1]|nr:unnamed protein product [Phytomonas sp. EM1]|eukprot:CCW64895.1 unnamed protein product [Phytomonas sp. isolate EM1]
MVLSPLRGRLVLRATRPRAGGFLSTNRSTVEEGPRTKSGVLAEAATKKENEPCMSPIKQLLLRLRSEGRVGEGRGAEETTRLRLLSPLNEAAAAEPTTREADPNASFRHPAAEPLTGGGNRDSKLGISATRASSASGGLFPSGIPRIWIQPPVLPVFLFDARSPSPEVTTYEAPSVRHPSCRGVLSGRGDSPRYVYYYDTEVDETGKEPTGNDDPLASSSSGSLKETASPRDPKSRRTRSPPRASGHRGPGEEGQSNLVLRSDAELHKQEEREVETFWIDETETHRRRKNKAIGFTRRGRPRKRR